MIYIDDHIWDFDLTAALAAVSAQRRDYAMQYVQELDRRLSVASYLLLKRALSQEYGMDSVPPFVFEPKGKPRLEGFPDIHFNLSHCRDAAVCVLAPHPVGIDVESIDRYDESLLHHMMNADECRRIAASKQPAAEFIRMWTMKESLLKLTGQGLADENLLSVLNEAHRYRFDTMVTSKYVCTVCTSATD